MNDFNEGLKKHLLKSELEYRAKMLPKGSEVDWLAPYCDNVKSIADFMRSIGFKIKAAVDEGDSFGEKHQWVVTTNGVIVYVNSEYCKGFMAAAHE